MRHPKASATYSTLDPFLHFLLSGYNNLGDPCPFLFLPHSHALHHPEPSVTKS